MGIRILGTGSYLPSKVLTNDDIAKSLDTTDEWIFSHTGIHSRHVAGEGESSSVMGAAAARKALEAAGVKPEEIALLIVATSTADYNPFPSTACVVQGILGCTNAYAYDLQAACTGFIFALENARAFLSMHPDKKALVVASECMTRAVDWSDRSSCILFGDGAGAVVVAGGGAETASFKAQSVMGADGTGANLIMRSGGCRDALPLDPNSGVPMRVAPEPATMAFMGHQVYAFAVRTLARVVGDLCAAAGVAPEALDWVFAHQANARILDATARRMKLPLEKFYMNLETTANTSAASIPIAIDEAVRSGALKDGMKITMIGFGAGLTYGGIISTWPEL